MSVVLTGLDWGAVALRLEGADADTRARVIYLAGAVEAGAVAASAAIARETGGAGNG
ncbi:MAG TPA: hypothetical protein PKY87_17480 [Terricaulis sp.]|nr:hypothetical protein [Terricaulis sp.]